MFNAPQQRILLKSKNPKFCNWTEVLDLNITKPIKIRQFFLKYTKCKEDEEPNEETIEKNDELEIVTLLCVAKPSTRTAIAPPEPR